MTASSQAAGARIGPRSLPLVAALAAVVLSGGCDPADPPVATAIEIFPSAPVLVDAPDTVRLGATVRDQNGKAVPGVPVAWSSSDTFIVKLSEDGLVTADEPGTALVRASAATVTAEASIVVEPGPRAVLHKVYRVTGGEDWENSTNWKTDAPLHTWHGLLADAQGNIAWLNLSDNGLTGEIPPEVGTLKSLVTLGFPGNRLTGSIPPELGDLENLQVLNLRSNQLTGSIPPELGRLGNLEDLRLPGNALTGSIPSEFATLRNLGILNLDSLQLTGPIPPELGNLQNLRVLYLRFNQLTGPIPPELGTLQGLEALFLDGNELTGPVPGELGSIQQLRSVRIADNPLRGPLPRDLIGLPLVYFHWNNTELCAPADDAFQKWLNSIFDNVGNGDCGSQAARG